MSCRNCGHAEDGPELDALRKRVEELEKLVVEMRGYDLNGGRVG